MKPKEKAKKKVEWFRPIMAIYLILALIIIIHGVTIYFIGFHNMDLGHNIKIINERYNLDLHDINNNFEVWDSTKMYITGSNQMDAGFYTVMLGCFLFGTSLFGLWFGVGKR